MNGPVVCDRYFTKIALGERTDMPKVVVKIGAAETRVHSGHAEQEIDVARGLAGDVCPCGRPHGRAAPWSAALPRVRSEVGLRGARGADRHDRVRPVKIVFNPTATDLVSAVVTT